jgi:hypothetical protein
MINSIKFSIACFTLLISTTVFSQNAQGYASVLLTADTTTKSVLISNLLADQTGSESPFIGAASWSDKGKRLQCRSLLSFDYSKLPKYLRADQIDHAELILVPVELGTKKNYKKDLAPKLVVQRLAEYWEDSMVTWVNQPVADLQYKVAKNATGKLKDKVVKFNVTALVKKMFEYGNNGFLITYKDSVAANEDYSHWFASAKNENEEIRPLLLIFFSVGSPVYFTNAISPLPIMTTEYSVQNYWKTEPVIVAPQPSTPANPPPVKTPVDKTDN